MIHLSRHESWVHNRDKFEPFFLIFLMENIAHMKSLPNDVNMLWHFMEQPESWQAGWRNLWIQKKNSVSEFQSRKTFSSYQHYHWNKGSKLWVEENYNFFTHWWTAKGQSVGMRLNSFFIDILNFIMFDF